MFRLARQTESMKDILFANGCSLKAIEVSDQHSNGAHGQSPAHNIEDVDGWRDAAQQALRATAKVVACVMCAGCGSCPVKSDF